MPPKIEGGGSDAGVPERLKESSSSPSVDFADDSGGSTRETVEVVEASPHRLSEAENKVADSDGGKRETTTVTEAAPQNLSEAERAILDGESSTDGFGPDPVNTTAEAIEQAGGTSFEENARASEGGVGGVPGSPGVESVTDYTGQSSRSGTNVTDKEVTTPDENPGGGAAGELVNDAEDAVNDAAESAKNAAEAAKNEVGEHVDVNPDISVDAGNLVEYALGAAIVGGLAYAASGSGSGGGA